MNWDTLTLLGDFCAVDSDVAEIAKEKRAIVEKIILSYLIELFSFYTFASFREPLQS